jgi:hypothetical protein
VAGLGDSTRNRFRTLGLTLWRNRTKLAGYLGVVAGALQMGFAEGQHWPMLLLGAAVAGIGHFNDQQRAPPQ